ncbi:MAG: SGNH/GDSL hydrolase family protein [Rikenellaceae bacterium]
MKNLLIFMLSLLTVTTYASEKLNSSAYHKLHPETFNSKAVFDAGGGVVAYLGGSITYNPGWRDMTTDYIKKSFPKADINFIAAGIPSLGSLAHAFRMQTDIFDKAIPDLMFVEVAVNDRSNGYSDKNQLLAIEGIVRQALRANPKMDIVFMAFADPDKLADYAKGVTPKEIENEKTITDHYSISMIDLSKEVYDRIKNEEFAWEKDFKDLHPSPFGQQIYFNSIKTALDNLWSSKAEKVSLKMPKPLDKACFDNGHYGEIESANSAPMFTYHKSYKPTDGVGLREGFYDVPMLVSEKPDQAFVYKFKGNTIGIAIIAGPDAGMIEYMINGKSPKMVNLFTPWSENLHLPWYIILETGLSSGTNYLSVNIIQNKSSKSKGNACRIVHFLVN